MRWMVGIVTALVACGPASPGVVVPTETASPAKTTERASAPAPASAALVASAVQGVAAEPQGSGVPPEAFEWRQKGLAAMDAGRPLDAIEAFKRALDIAPGNDAAAALLEASQKALARSQARASASLSGVTPARVEPAPLVYTLVTPAPVAAGPIPKLVKVSEARNQITDDVAWFQRNGLAPITLEVPNPFRRTPGNLPPDVPTRFGNLILMKAVRTHEGTTLHFGENFGGARIVAVLDQSGALVGLLDFQAWRVASRVAPGDEDFVDMPVTWAQAVDSVLYVSHGHRTYAKSTFNENAYLSAIDLRTGKLLWRSQPLVSNAASFVIHGAAIFAGYGFTAEPDYLYVLDRATGKVTSKIPVASGPEILVEKDGKLFVRCYDTDYVFAIREG